MNYWLSKDGINTEGPFSVEQLQRMYDSGAVTSRAQVCMEGGDEWTSLSTELEIERVANQRMKPQGRPVQQVSFEESMRRRDEQLAGTFGNAINWITVVVCLTGVVPVLGLLAYGVWGIWALVATVLCVLQMSKGQVSGGIWNLIGVWIFAPLIITGLQFASLRVFAALAEQ